MDGQGSGAASEPPDGVAWNAATALTADEALAMDGWLASELGLSLEQLMEVAGARVADVARELVREHGLAEAVFLVGPGHNGGDALVAERLLRAELHTLVWRPLSRPRPAEPVAPAGAAAPRVTTTAPRVTTTAPALGARTLLVDGLFGVGLRRPLQGAARAAAAHIDASDATVLSIDIPSGLHATTGAVPAARGSPRGVAIRADLTLTFVAPKRGFFLGSGPALVGAWRVVDLGFPPRLAHEWLARRRAAEAAP